MSKQTTPDPLDALAAQASSLEQTAPPPDQATQDQEAADAQAMAAIEQGMVKVLMMALKVGRALIARKVPEIKDEWPDELLEQPAIAAVPLLRKHVASLMSVVGSSPELAAFVLSLFPLGMGLMTAMEKADKRARDEANNQAGAGGLDGPLTDG